MVKIPEDHNPTSHTKIIKIYLNSKKKLINGCREVLKVYEVQLMINNQLGYDSTGVMIDSKIDHYTIQKYILKKKITRSDIEVLNSSSDEYEC